MRSKMVHFAFQNGAFCVPKVAVLHSKSAGFAKRYSGVDQPFTMNRGSESCQIKFSFAASGMGVSFSSPRERMERSLCLAGRELPFTPVILHKYTVLTYIYAKTDLKRFFS